MIKTGKYKIHPITQEEVEIVILQESDFNFSKDWEQLTVNEKADFLSFMEIEFLNKNNEPEVKKIWNGYKIRRN